jgi:N-acylglucosamine 2-epimerase
MVRKLKNDWDNKLWWPHSEALYSTLLSYSLTKDKGLAELYNEVHDYTFATFPNPDKQVGEWIQIRDRQGKPVTKVVALPVKDPFHIARSFMLIIELLRGAR